MLSAQLGDGESLCEKFASFFTDKIDRIRAAVDSVPVTNFALNHDTDLEQSTTTTLDYFKDTTEAEVGKIIKFSKSTTWSLDPLPTEIIKKTSSAHIPAFTRLINASFESGIVPLPLKKALVTPILKKHGLDVNILANYRPLSNLPFTTKVMEKIAVHRLSEHLHRIDSMKNCNQNTNHCTVQKQRWCVFSTILQMHWIPTRQHY